MVKSKHHPAPAPPRPTPGAISPLRAHLYVPGGEQETLGLVGTQSKDSEEGTPLYRASQGCPRKASASPSRYDTHHDGLRGAAVDPLLDLGGCCLRCGTCYGMTGKGVLRLHKNYYVMFTEGTRGGEGDGFR